MQPKPEPLSGLVLDGSQTRGHTGGACVAYQGRKKAQTTTQLCLTDTDGMVVGLGLPQSSNHHDCDQLVGQVKGLLTGLKILGFEVQGTLLHADKGFDNKAFRKDLQTAGLVPNIAQNKRNRKKAKPGPKRAFEAAVYKVRFLIERTVAWFDRFKALLVRYETWIEFTEIRGLTIGWNSIISPLS